MMRANHRILALALVMGLTGAYLLAPRPASRAAVKACVETVDRMANLWG